MPTAAKIMSMKRPAAGLRRTLAFAALLVAAAARGAPDEIQVYIDDVQERGQRGLEMHVNYALSARKSPDYPGEQAPARVLRITPEFSFGLGGNWDWGIYVPTSIDNNTGSAFIDGFKLRLKYLVNNQRDAAAEFYGGNVELARTPRRTSPSDWRAELRGIVGVRRGPWLFALNPILSTPLSSSVADSTVDVDINLKVSREVREGIAVGIEHYAEFGPVRRPTFGPDAGQSTFVAVDLEGKGWDLNLGIGHGWNENTDKRVLKMILGIPF